MKLRSAIRQLVRGGYPIVTPLIRNVYRLNGIYKYGILPLRDAIKWYFMSKEYTNFTYGISEKSKKYLVGFLSNVFDKPINCVHQYRKEVEEDKGLREFLASQVSQTADRYCADLPIKYGRRIGWYILVRLLKPRFVVESGVDRGIGTCILAAAILRNQAEGFGGRVIGLDINPFAGRYIAPPYGDIVEIAYGTSLSYLENLSQTVDLFIHDSDHSPDYEMKEYELVRDKLSPDGVLVSDNAELTTCLFDFAQKNSMAFWYWQEEVVDHVATGGGIGLAIPRT